jgi:hypothetical protein
VKVIVDTNVVLDVLLSREPFLDAATGVFELIERGHIEGMLCANSITTIDYLLSRSIPPQKSRDTLRRLLSLFSIAPVNRIVIEEALQSAIRDFEDAVVEQAGRLAGADMIVTRNIRDFHRSSIKTLAPDELLATF